MDKIKVEVSNSHLLCSEKLSPIYMVFQSHNYICVWDFYFVFVQWKGKRSMCRDKVIFDLFVFNFIFFILVFWIFILYLCSGKVRGACAVTKLTWSAPSKADISVTSGATSALAPAFLLFCNSSSISLMELNKTILHPATQLLLNIKFKSSDHYRWKSWFWCIWLSVGLFHFYCANIKN